MSSSVLELPVHCKYIGFYFPFIIPILTANITYFRDANLSIYMNRMVKFIVIYSLATKSNRHTNRKNQLEQYISPPFTMNCLHVSNLVKPYYQKRTELEGDL